MDISTEYVNMCREAKEIQELADYSNGEYFHAIKATRCGESTSSDYQTFMYIECDDNFYSEVPFFGLYGKKIVTWLPRQDQLQDIFISHMNNRNLDYSKITGKTNIPEYVYFFNEYLVIKAWNIQGIKRVPSMEMMILAFIMEKTFNKQWNGKTWIKI